MRLEGFAERLPRQLSGGQQQRVALARALVIEPDVLLLDEPLSNLDAKLRQEVRVEIRELQRQLGLTTIMVTHDQEEALTMADRLVVMSERRDPPDRHAARPVRAPGRPLRRGLRRPQHVPATGASTAPGAVRDRGRPAAACRDDARPARPRWRCGRSASASAPPTAMDNCLPGTVEFVSYLGARARIHVRLSPADRVMVQLPNRGDARAGGRRRSVEVGWQRDCRTWCLHELN